MNATEAPDAVAVSLLSVATTLSLTLYGLADIRLVDYVIVLIVCHFAEKIIPKLVQYLPVLWNYFKGMGRVMMAMW
jgi:hypothetical protein